MFWHHIVPLHERDSAHALPRFWHLKSGPNACPYHWSSAKFSSTWYDTLSVLVAKGRARVSVAASEADWSKRIREMQYADYEDHTVGS